MLTRRLNTIYQIIVSILLAVIFMIVANIAYGFYLSNNQKWLAGKTGTHCYSRNNGHGNIKYNVYFETLEECEKYVERNK